VPVKLHRLLAVVPLLVAAACSGGDDDASPPADSATAVDDAGDPETDETDEASADDAGGESEPVETVGTTATTTPSTAATTEPAGAALLGAGIVPARHVPLAAAVKLEFDEPVQVQVTATSGDHVVETALTAEPSAQPIVPVVGMRADRTYDITVEALVDGAPVEVATPEPLTFDTPPLPDWMPAHRVTSDPDRVSPGITIIESSPTTPPAPEGTTTTTAAPATTTTTTATGTGTVAPAGPEPVYPTAVAIGYDPEGEIVWYYTNQGLGGIEQTQHGTFIAHYGPFGAREFDMLGNVVNHWRPSFADGNGTRNPGGLPEGNDGDAPPITVDPEWVELRSFHHEVLTMPNGNLLALSTTLHELTPEQRATICPDDPIEFTAVSDVIVEFTPEGEALRTWDLFDVVDVVEIPGTDMCATGGGLFASQVNRDWTHANSVVYDEVRDAILISSRHTEQIIALDHLDDEGPQAQLRWIIGVGATMPLDGDEPYHQHAVEVLDDGAIILYDNGNARPGTEIDDPVNPTYSRAVIYEVDDAGDDPATWTARQRWQHIAYEDDGSPVFTSFIGDADMMANGNVLITHGGIGPFPPVPESPLRALIIEVVPEGDEGGPIVWQLDSDPAQSHTVYRSEKVETFYLGDDWMPRI
jgi:hypothetical protein